MLMYFEMKLTGWALNFFFFFGGHFWSSAATPNCITVQHEYLQHTGIIGIFKHDSPPFFYPFTHSSSKVMMNDYDSHKENA